MYDGPGHARQCLADFKQRHSTVRPHWALVPAEGGDPLTPYEVYPEAWPVQIPKWQSWALAAREELERMLAEVA